MTELLARGRYQTRLRLKFRFVFAMLHGLLRRREVLRRAVLGVVNMFRVNLFRVMIIGALIGTGLPPVSQSVQGQDVTIIKTFPLSGTVQSIRRGQLTVTNANGNAQTFKYQQEEAGVIAVNGGKAVVEAPAKIKVVGTMPASVLRVGSMIEATIRVTRAGRCVDAIDVIRLMNLDIRSSVLETSPPSATGEPFGAHLIVRIIDIKPKSIQVEIPPNEFIAKEKINIPLMESLAVKLEDDDLNYVQPGDIVTRCAAAELSTGDLVIGEIEVELLPRKELISSSFDERLQQQFSHLSDLPPDGNRVERSKHFILHTDLSERRVQILLHKLETMVDLVSDYYRRPPRQIIECYVVEDLKRWPANQFDLAVAEKIRAKEGFTVTASRGSERKSVVYSYAHDSVVQHEAVHAYCNQTFDSGGPFWYSEGMAELGKYWKPGESDVSVHPFVVEFLRSGEPLKLEQIITDGRIAETGWQDYAWRWAVCHFLASNPNYSARFKTLGSNLMNARDNESFGAAYGEQENEIRFEFEFFMKHLQNDLRADLIAWQWKKKTKVVTGSRKVSATIQADYGWQATGAILEPGTNYSLTTEGTWQTSSELEAVDANGAANGQGKLIGIMLKDYQLSEPFEIGNEPLFQVPTGGHLFVRCQDEWSEIDDNEGQISVSIKMSKQ